MTAEDSKAQKPRVQLVIGIIRQGDEILLVRESLGAAGEILWSLPGGGVEDGELMHEALRRELREETGLLVGDPVRTAFLMHRLRALPFGTGRCLRDRRVVG
ncbi:NUDIX hydrolase [Streptomyces sp. NBC_00385]|uniref:NUDIX hydrolase n=1 Tax=Streptomyces sp. NBC_00385 TaxID=2975733 RepID=UPI002DDB1D4D|nr:NUDIX hydrolase [Streptomyces sp. NBC_00385]WRZ03017.1 NUDIX hydrolase [Streptomyces sp. NBC_00385]